jgi:glycosyltransferase involved in cell wall biosynthesis
VDIAYVFPNHWPYVRRGAERLTIEYSRHMIAAGHTVDVITSKPGKRRVVREGRLTVYYEPQITHPMLSRYWSMFRFYSFSFTALPHLARRAYDAVHVWFYPYALAARFARRLRGSPYLYHSMVDPLVLPGRVDRWTFHQAVRPADRVAALTGQSAATLEEMLQVPVWVLPACVDMELFRPRGVRDLAEPRVLFTSDMRDERKGAALLLRAWSEIHRKCPEAVLTFAGPFGQGGLRGFDPLTVLTDLVHDRSARSRIELAGEGRPEDLPRRYAEAAVTVLPAIEEAFGLVLIESLACGTPVVANRSGGPGEIVNDPGLGSTVSIPDRAAMDDPARASELAQAVLDGIELSRNRATVQRCRERAAEWSRERVGRLVEETYVEMSTRYTVRGQDAR